MVSAMMETDPSNDYDFIIKNYSLPDPTNACLVAELGRQAVRQHFEKLDLGRFRDLVLAGDAMITI